MTVIDRPNLSSLLAKAAAALDIPEHVYEDATLKYEDVGDWLAAQDSELAQYSPEIYVQGSFRLGTVVRPINDTDEYDIDLVCLLSLRKDQTTQAELKDRVGRRLKKRDDLAKMLTPSRRCWTLDYPSEKAMPGFHMDVLPCIPNGDHLPTGLLLTDTELRLWQNSNPKAYAEWFYGRMKLIFESRRAEIAKAMAASIEDVPEWQVKTPLQVAVQLLKRHRDIFFQGRGDIRPVSIILTTLAARAYAGEVDIMDTLRGVLSRIEANWGKPGYVENRNGRWWVENPTVPDENFADKWNEYPERREAFWAWMQRVKSDFGKAESTRTLNEAVDVLTPVLGKRALASAAGDLGLATLAIRAVGNRGIMVPALGDTAHVQRPLWPELRRYTASIRADVHYAAFAKKRLWPMTDRPVPKGTWLKFTVRTDAPQPHEIKWQVVNTGAEAMAAHQPRGDFYSSDQGLNGTRWEHTAYSGTHWVEGFVIMAGQCVARTGKLYVKVR